MGETLTGHDNNVGNPASLARKVLGGGQKKNILISKILYDIVD